MTPGTQFVTLPLIDTEQEQKDSNIMYEYMCEFMKKVKVTKTQRGGTEMKKAISKNVCDAAFF
jgi:hypothetical protein